jgi:hypothetical protein
MINQGLATIDIESELEKVVEETSEKNLVLTKKEYGNDFQKHLLEQYKLYVGTSLEITSKRLEANKFYLTLSSIVFGFASYLTMLNQYAVILLLSVVGILISIMWKESILAYRLLNSAKFKVIYELEKHLPACVFKCEKEHYSKKYRGLTSVEKWCPVIFILLYASIIFLITYTYLVSVGQVLT